MMQLQFVGGPLDGAKDETHPKCKSVWRVDPKTGVVHRYKLRVAESPNRVAIFEHQGAVKHEPWQT